MSGSIFFANETLKHEVDNLRMQEYAKASGFAVDLSTLRWRQSDNESFVMVAKMGEQIVSTMRGEVIEDLSLLEKKLECPWSFTGHVDMPVLLLSRAATLSSYRAAGLNLVLRYWFLKFAHHHAIPSVVGTFVSGSPRENTLREMGYQFFENKLGWQQSTYRSLRPVSVVLLDMNENGRRAVEYCEARASEGLASYSLNDSFPSMRVVGCL